MTYFDDGFLHKPKPTSDVPCRAQRDPLEQGDIKDVISADLSSSGYYYHVLSAIEDGEKVANRAFMIGVSIGITGTSALIGFGYWIGNIT